MLIREIVASDIPWSESLVAEYFAVPRIVSRGVLHNICELSGLIAKVDSKRVGLLQYRRNGSELEIVVLICTIRRRGIGRALIEALKDKACRVGSERLWLITTNNNRDAQAFYKALGWKLAAIHNGSNSGV